ncbi:MAG: hypothetical protein JNG84_04655 [Archangium sp.]|nr:hypothetical protein [Archangium sp.]
MGTLKIFLDGKSITPKHIVSTSQRIEGLVLAERAILVKRVAKRKDKEQATKKYDELNLTKPKGLGRGVSAAQLDAALGDKAVPKKVRTKIHRAVNAILTKKGQPAADFKALFEGSTAKAGKKPKEAAAKK